MRIAADIARALGPRLLRNGLQLRRGAVEETLIRLRDERDGQSEAALQDWRSLHVEDVWLSEHLRVRTYVPKEGSASGMLINIHGGGWVAGSIEKDHLRCCALSEKTNCVTVSVGYRLAPENRFPLAIEDCVTAISWAFSKAEYFGLKRKEVIALGSSAGANLLVAAMICIAERTLPCMPKRQVLLYPICDAGFKYASYQENESGCFLSLSDVRWYWDQYIDPEAKRNYLASIVHAPDLSSLPPGLIITCQFDPLRDEGEALAARLQEANVDINCVRYLGAIHGFVSLAPESNLAKLALASIIQEVNAGFSR